MYDKLIYPYFAEKVASKIETNTDQDTSLSEKKDKLMNAKLSESEDEDESDCTTPVLKTQFISKMMSVHEEEDEAEEHEKLGVTKDEIMDEIGVSESEVAGEPRKDVETEND
jgi:predicted transcriptional regulator